jgi:hypothetical protein
VTRKGYIERGEARAKAQHEILISSLEKVAGDAEGENGGWKIILREAQVDQCTSKP